LTTNKSVWRRRNPGSGQSEKKDDEENPTTQHQPIPSNLHNRKKNTNEKQNTHYYTPVDEDSANYAETPWR
jgi:hypothetical protein